MVAPFFMCHESLSKPIYYFEQCVYIKVCVFLALKRIFRGKVGTRYYSSPPLPVFKDSSRDHL
ncbi:hypothetical protein DIKCMJMK_02065 [Shewanella oneidensis]|nr:hypothetical protein [Shewanella oneidensis]